MQGANRHPRMHPEAPNQFALHPHRHIGAHHFAAAARPDSGAKAKNRCGIRPPEHQHRAQFDRKNRGFRFQRRGKYVPVLVFRPITGTDRKI